MPDSKRIRELNDALRVNMVGGRIAATPGVLALRNLPAVLERLRAFSEFDSRNDSHHEHDFGAFKVAANDGLEKLVVFKIDYYDPQLMMGSPDPADPAITARVLTLMLAEEY